MTTPTSRSGTNPPPKRPDDPKDTKDPKDKDDKTDKNDEQKKEDAAMKAYEQILMQFMNDKFSELVSDVASTANAMTDSSPMKELFEGEE